MEAQLKGKRSERKKEDKEKYKLLKEVYRDHDVKLWNYEEELYSLKSQLCVAQEQLRKHRRQIAQKKIQPNSMSETEDRTAYISRSTERERNDGACV
jgi:Co/Zn/Cd efflux system component